MKCTINISKTVLIPSSVAPNVSECAAQHGAEETYCTGKILCYKQKKWRMLLANDHFTPSKETLMKKQINIFNTSILKLQIFISGLFLVQFILSTAQIGKVHVVKDNHGMHVPGFHSRRVRIMRNPPPKFWSTPEPNVWPVGSEVEPPNCETCWGQTWPPWFHSCVYQDFRLFFSLRVQLLIPDIVSIPHPDV